MRLADYSGQFYFFLMRGIAKASECFNRILPRIVRSGIFFEKRPMKVNIIYRQLSEIV